MQNITIELPKTLASLIKSALVDVFTAALSLFIWNTNFCLEKPIITFEIQ